MNRALLLALLALALSSGVQAQSLTPGTRLRVATPEGRHVGYVERATADSLVLLRPGGGRAAVAWREVEGAEYSLGRRGQAGRGALIGVGAGVALTLFYAATEDPGGNLGAALLMGLAINCSLGAGLGAVIGGAWQTERWAALPVGPAPGASAAPGLGPGVGLTFRF